MSSETLKLKINEYLCPLFFYTNKKNFSKLEKFKSIIMKKLSLETIVNHFQDIDKLKYLLFTNEEIGIFDTVNFFKLFEENKNDSLLKKINNNDNKSYAEAKLIV